jgi:hypothetical protein
MRTKTLLLSAAVFAAGLIASQAQAVYSVNSVGYVNLNLGAQYTLICNPLNNSNNLLSQILPSVPEDTLILKWNADAQAFDAPSQFYAPPDGWIPDTTLNPGQGAFIYLPPGGATVTFVGEVPQGNLVNQIHGNYSLLSSIVPQSISLANPSVNLPVIPDDLVLFWDNASQGFEAPLQYYEDIGWLPNEPVPAVGEGFFYYTGAGAGRNWNRTFSVN